MRHALTALLRMYHNTLSPIMFNPSCRYYPSCSIYLAEAIEHDGVRRGLWRGLTRLLRCHPWGGSGVDLIGPTACRESRSCRCA